MCSVFIRQLTHGSSVSPRRRNALPPEVPSAPRHAPALKHMCKFALEALFTRPHGVLMRHVYDTDAQRERERQNAKEGMRERANTG